MSPTVNRVTSRQNWVRPVLRAAHLHLGQMGGQQLGVVDRVPSVDTGPVERVDGDVHEHLARKGVVADLEVAAGHAAFRDW